MTILIKRPIESAEIEELDPIDVQIATWRNGAYYDAVRKIDKNRFPRKVPCAATRDGRPCGRRFELRGVNDLLERQFYCGPDEGGNPRYVCWECSFHNKLATAHKTLNRLIDALPQVERDALSFDFRPPSSPAARLLDWGVLGYNAGRDARGVRDYAEWVPGLGFRQKAASTVRPGDFTEWLGRDIQLPDQWLLQQIGRLFKAACLWPKRGPRSLYDKARSASWKKGTLRKPGDVSIQLETATDAVKLANAKKFRTARLGGSVEHPEGAAQRHARLESAKEAYNARNSSYLSATGLSARFILNNSLNDLPRDIIRDNMLTNLASDFGREIIKGNTNDTGIIGIRPCVDVDRAVVFGP